MKGIVFDIQRFSLHDGPGIRTTVFLKGCPLRCIWCHNPESWLMKPQLMYKKEYNTSKIVGLELTPEAVMEEVEADIDYYRNSGGGLTVSGGEPMLQFDFLKELLALAKKRNIHTCIETCGYSDQENYRQILDLTDLFLFDYKATEPERHKDLTGVCNALILQNLDFLYQSGAHIILRCPLVPGINDTDAHIEGIARLMRKYPGLKGTEILPYHDMGRGKWEELGKTYMLNDLKSAEDAEKSHWREKFRQLGCDVVIS